MPTDPLDDRIKALVADAVSSAPPAPSLTMRAPVAGTQPRRGLLWAGIGIAACLAAVAVLVWSSGDEDRSIVGASTTVTTEPSASWPEGVAAVVASERGIELVRNENGSAVVTRVLDGVPVTRAIQVENGGFVYQETGGDIRYIAPDGTVQETALVTDDGSGTTVLEDADMPNGQLRLVYRTSTTDPAASFDLGVWFQPAEPRYELPPGGYGVGYSRFTIVDEHKVVAATLDDVGARALYTSTYQNGVPGSTSDSGVEAVAAAGDGAGSIGWVTEDGRWTTTGVRDGSQPGVAKGLAVSELDWRGQWLMIDQGLDVPATLVDLVTETRYQVPVANGLVTLSRYAVPSTENLPTTVAPNTVLPEALPAVVTAGLNGVWEFGPDGETQWTDEPMAFAVKAPNGSMLMQRHSGGNVTSGWTQADTMPLWQASPGAPIESLFSLFTPEPDAAPGWYTLHDSAMVGDRPLVLMDRQADQVNIESPPGALLVLDLDAGSLAQIGQVGGWESGVSRLHLAESGVIVGEAYSGADRSLFVRAIDNGPTFGPSNLGLQESYSDCSDCPRLYTISRDGSTVAWLDGTQLRRWMTSGAEIALGTDVGGISDASNLSIGAGVAAIDRGFAGALSTPIIVHLDDTEPRTEELPPAARTALP